MDSLHGGEIFLCRIRIRAGVQLQGEFLCGLLRNLQTNAQRDDKHRQYENQDCAKLRVKNLWVGSFPTLAVRQSSLVRCDGHQLQCVDEEHAVEETTATLVVAALGLPLSYCLCHNNSCINWAKKKKKKIPLSHSPLFACKALKTKSG